MMLLQDLLQDLLQYSGRSGQGSVGKVTKNGVIATLEVAEDL